MLRFIANPIYPEAHKHLNDHYSGVMPNPGRLFTDETLRNKLKTDSEILSIVRNIITSEMIALDAAQTTNPVTTLTPLINSAALHVSIGKYQGRLNRTNLELALDDALANSKDSVEIRIVTAHLYFGDGSEPITYLDWSQITMTAPTTRRAAPSGTSLTAEDVAKAVAKAIPKPMTAVELATAFKKVEVGATTIQRCFRGFVVRKLFLALPGRPDDNVGTKYSAGDGNILPAPNTDKLLCHGTFVEKRLLVSHGSLRDDTVPAVTFGHGTDIDQPLHVPPAPNIFVVPSIIGTNDAPPAPNINLVTRIVNVAIVPLGYTFKDMATTTDAHSLTLYAIITVFQSNSVTRFVKLVYRANCVMLPPDRLVVDCNYMTVFHYYNDKDTTYDNNISQTVHGLYYASHVGFIQISTFSCGQRKKKIPCNEVDVQGHTGTRILLTFLIHLT